MIATFNWDPFLILAHVRNRVVGTLPEIRFLHGCVRYASCPDHDVLGQPGEYCRMCRNALVQSSIMFPHHEKDYARDGIIARDVTTEGGKLLLDKAVARAGVPIKASCFCRHQAAA